MLIRERWKDFRSYLRENIGYICIAAIVVLAVYGIRAFRSSFCIDSEIMISQPDYMKSIWLGSNRFGMYTISEIFGLGRLSPYLSGFLMMITMWITAVVLSFASQSWGGKAKDSRMFTLLFPLLAVTSPLFAEQYLFILQAFEISMGLLLTVIAVYCVDIAIRAVEGDEGIWQKSQNCVYSKICLNEDKTDSLNEEAFNSPSETEKQTKSEQWQDCDITAKLSHIIQMGGDFRESI